MGKLTALSEFIALRCLLTSESNTHLLSRLLSASFIPAYFPLLSIFIAYFLWHLTSANSFMAFEKQSVSTLVANKRSATGRSKEHTTTWRERKPFSAQTIEYRTGNSLCDSWLLPLSTNRPEHNNELFACLWERHSEHNKKRDVWSNYPLSEWNLAELGNNPDLFLRRCLLHCFLTYYCWLKTASWFDSPIRLLHRSLLNWGCLPRYNKSIVKDILMK